MATIYYLYFDHNTQSLLKWEPGVAVMQSLKLGQTMAVLHDAYEKSQLWDMFLPKVTET